MEHSTHKNVENSLDVNEIKKCLLSRKIQKKILAAKRLYQFLVKNPTEKCHIKLLNADLVEMLCEASCTTNIFLLKCIFRCIFIFIEGTQFFQQNRTAYTLESIIRALHIVIKSENGNDTLILGLQLLCDIICRLSSQKIALNTICNVPNIINLIKQLFSNDSQEFNAYIGTEVLISLLHSDGILKFKKIMEDTISEALKILVEIFRKNKDKTCIVIISEVVNRSMRFLVHPKVEATADISKSDIFVKLFFVMKEILTPFLIEHQDILHESDLGMIQVILSALLSIYHYPEEPITEEFSHFLVSEGFLNFLPMLEARTNVMELIIVIRSLLFELLQCISNSVLGRDNWKNLLLPGFEALPPGGSYKAILYLDSSEVIPIASIIYNYFFLISSSNPTVDADFLKILSYYILSLSGIPSACITKAVWFIFAVAYLCSSENFHYSKIATTKLINFIMHYNIHEVYTHHPAILYWVFSNDSMTYELQMHVIKFWLDENDEKSINELKTLLAINGESCLVMMGLMASESRLSRFIHKILKSILLKSNINTDYIIDHAWAILPQYLAQLSSFSDFSNYECLANLMKFCCFSKPKTLDISLVLRISCLLPGAFTKYLHSFLSSDIKGKIILDDHHIEILQSTFNLVNNLIKISLHKNDKRVSAVYLKHEAFLNTVEIMFTEEDDTISTSLMQLLTSFLQCQIHSSQKSSKIIHIDVTSLIKFLCGTTDLCIATLKFLAIYLELISEKVVLPLVNVPLPSGIQLRTLYFHIHMVCAKSEGEILIYCWLCLRRLLELSDSIGLKNHLASIPYTSVLLLRSCETEAWKEAITFVPTWLTNLPSHESRALNTPNSVRTLNKLNEKLAKTIKDPNILTVVSKMLHLSGK